MRILYINDAIAIWGGLERILVEKANYLTNHYGYDVAIVTSEQGEHKVPYSISPQIYLKDLGIRFHQQYNYRGIKRFFKYFNLHRSYLAHLRKMINEFQPDVIVVMRVELVSDVLKVKGTIPLIFESHACCKCDLFEGYGFWRRIRYSWHIYHATKADTIVALTNCDAADWRNYSKKVQIIPNMVNLNKSNRYSSHESKDILFVGRLSKQKNIDGLLRIWKIVSNRFPEWSLHIYGEGDEETALMKSISCMDGNVVLHKPISNLNDIYLNGSMLLLTSLYEPFGLVMPEAMSYGLPVVAFDCPYGPSDIITDGLDGFLIKEGDVSAFASKVCILIEDRQLRMQMGVNAIKSSQRYLPDNIMLNWKNLFEKYLK